jgi:signal transduction histidine kinase
MSCNVRTSRALRNRRSGELRRRHGAHDDPPSGGFAVSVASVSSTTMATAAAAPPQGVIRPFVMSPRREMLIDVAIAGVAFSASVMLLARHVSPLQPEKGQLNWVSGALIACSTLPLAAWRRAPRTVFVVTSSACVLLGGLGYSIGLPAGAAIALYLLAASRTDADPWTRRDTATAVTLFVAYLGATAFGSRGFPWSELFHAGLAWTVAWFAGERSRLRRERLAELEVRARRAERELERERLLALAEERARIARDLHDSVGHAINVIVVRAGAARMHYDRDPDRSRAAIVAIEEVARQTAGEIDQIVGTLRDPGHENEASTAPLGLASLPRLTAHHAAVGLDVTVATAGPPRALDHPVDLAAYRILQEALTNAARHGAGAAQVELSYCDSALGLTITNPVRDSSPEPANGGHGLIGMGERATLLGGSFDADRNNGTFRVRARLPYRGRRT